jgi:phosphoheptose isomerase
MTPKQPYTTLAEHLRDLSSGLDSVLEHEAEIDRWGRMLARRLDGGRLLVAGNGGSAAEAQHLTAELVGRFEGERRPLSAIALHADTSTVTAVGNDYGYRDVFARQVEAHGRAGDVLLLLTTSGRSPNLLEAADRARGAGMQVWALTGPLPNPLAARAHRVVAVSSGSVSAVQEAHLVVVHALCAAVERHLLPPARHAVRQDARPTVDLRRGAPVPATLDGAAVGS